MKVGIIGGGPAGIIAAGFAGNKNNDTILIEKNNKLGKKLFITGKGRCNITNASPIGDFFENITTNKNFLYSAFYSFTNNDIIELLKLYGVETKIERGNRVFPVSDKSSDVIKALKKFLLNNNVKVQLNSEVKEIKYYNNNFIVTYNNDQHIFNKLILTTGGKSYPMTGSTGDGYEFARKLGHNIKPLKASLVPIEIHEEWGKQLQGLSLKNIKLTASIDNRIIYEKVGEMLFTHYGVSGPIILSMSNLISKYKNNKEINLYIDLKPALSDEMLDRRILRDFEKYKNKQIKNALNDLLPQRLIEPIINLASVDPHKPIHQIKKIERYEILNTIKNLPLTLKKLRPIEHAIITSGGIDTKEINPSTMESKIVPGLFFAGEIIDVDGLTGGYNLQVAYSTGYLAGINV